MELIVKIKSDGSNPYYQDGDVVEAMSLDRIYLAHAEMICNPRNFDFNTFGDGAGEGPLGQQAKDDVGMGGGNLQGNLLGIGRQFKENGGNGHGH